MKQSGDKKPLAWCVCRKKGRWRSFVIARDSPGKDSRHDWRERDGDNE